MFIEMPVILYSFGISLDSMGSCLEIFYVVFDAESLCSFLKDYPKIYEQGRKVICAYAQTLSNLFKSLQTLKNLILVSRIPSADKHEAVSQ